MGAVGDNETDLLRVLTEREVTLSIPVLCLFTLFMTVGTIGNLLVLMTYFRRVSKASTNLFIFSLAMFDIINCCVGMPFDMYDLFNPYTNSLEYICRIHKFVKFAADLSSGYIIVCISFDRFMRIARPHRGFSLPHAKIAVVTVSVVSVLVCSMALFVYGSETVNLKSHPGISATRCGINEHAKQTAIPLLFYTIILVCFGVGVVILFIVYTRLGIKVRKWNRSRKDVKHDRQSTMYSHGLSWREESSSRMDTPDTPNTPKHGEMFTFPPVVFEEGEPSENDIDNEMPSSPRNQVTFRADFIRQISRSLNECNNLENLDVGHHSNGCVPRDYTKNNNVDDFKTGHAHDNGTRTLPLPRANKARIKPIMKNIRRKSSMLTLTDIRRRMKLTKTTVMFMVATIAFVASHIPYICVIIALMVTPEAVESMSSSEISLYRIAQHSYIMSYAANPLIYSFMNPKFRKECKDLIFKVIKKVMCKSKSFNLRD